MLANQTVSTEEKNAIKDKGKNEDDRWAHFVISEILTLDIRTSFCIPIEVEFVELPNEHLSFLNIFSLIYSKVNVFIVFEDQNDRVAQYLLGNILIFGAQTISLKD